MTGCVRRDDAHSDLAVLCMRIKMFCESFYRVMSLRNNRVCVGLFHFNS